MPAPHPRSPRHPLAIPVKIVLFGRHTEAVLVDISETGLFAHARTAIRALTDLVVEISIPGHAVSLSGYTQRVVQLDAFDPESCGIGVRFDESTPALRALLSELATGNLILPRALAPRPRAPAPHPGTPPARVMNANLVDRPFAASAPAAPSTGSGGARPMTARPTTARPSPRDSAPPPASADGNRRRAPRHFLRLVALVDRDEVGARAQVVDLSRTGARVEFDGRLAAVLEEGHEVRFRMNLRPKPGPIELYARVAWIVRAGPKVQVGLAFESLEDPMDARLDELLAMFAAGD